MLISIKCIREKHKSWTCICYNL